MMARGAASLDAGRGRAVFVPACAAMLLATPLWSEDFGPIPREACEPVYTVQKRGCEIDHVFLCEVDGERLVRIENIDLEEAPSYSLKTMTGDTVFEWDEENGPYLLGITENRDPSSTATLLSEGADSVDQDLTIRMPPFDTGDGSMSYVAEMTGAEISDNGVTFQEARALGKIRAYTLEMDFVGYLYVDAARDIVLEGEVTFLIDNLSQSYSGAPVTVALPGEPGFLSDRPLFDCGELS